MALKLGKDQKAVLKTLQVFADEKQGTVFQVSFVFIVIIYMLFGSAVFILLEGDRNEPQLNDKQKKCIEQVLLSVNPQNEVRSGLKFANDEERAQAIVDCTNDGASEEKIDPWSDFYTSLMFTFTVVTTIGYGHVAPATTTGRAFCMVYGIIGIPMAMMTVANVGKFLMEMMTKLTHRVNWLLNNENGSNEGSSDVQENPLDDTEELTGATASIVILISFLLYVLIGSMVMPVYEKEMDILTALYFNFVTLTTVGLGDVVPVSGSFLWFTMIYITVGLALTTMAIEIASQYLKKLHYAGRKMANPANAYVWFGGKKMKVKSLMRNLGEMYGISELSSGDNMHLLNAIVGNAVEKSENPQAYMNKSIVSRSSTDEFTNSVRARHLRFAGEPGVRLPYIDDPTPRVNNEYGNNNGTQCAAATRCYHNKHDVIAGEKLLKK